MDFKRHLIHFKDIIKLKFNTLIKILSQLVAEIFVVIGLFFIVFTTYKISYIAGNYCLGVILLLIGLFFANSR